MQNYLVKHLNNPEAGLKGFIVIHKKHKNYPSLGATRFLRYLSEREALKDAKNLAHLMTYKSALAGLPYGGAKGVIIAQKNYTQKKKNKIIESYARELNKLGGLFITGSDIGLDLKDVKGLKENTKFVIGLKANPEYYTAKGIFLSLEAVFKKIFGSKDLSGRSFVLQGLGKTGFNILKFISKNKGAKIFISDSDKKRVIKAKKAFPQTIPVSPASVFGLPCDVFMPCAVGGVLNKKNISRLKAKIVLGSTNNQLESKKSALLLQKRGIFYAPDYLVNSGGLISVAEELESKNPSKKSIMKKIEKMTERLERIMLESGKTGLPPSVVADKMAEKIFNEWT